MGNANSDIDLPTELFYYIVSYLEPHDLANISLVSSTTYTLINHSIVWKEKVQQYFPKPKTEPQDWKALFQLMYPQQHNICSECEDYPLHVRYECLHCDKVSLCESCWQTHPKTHLLMKTRVPQRKLNPNFTICETHRSHNEICVSCKQTIGDSKLFFCRKCNQNLCTKCKTQKHDPKHKFYELNYPTENLYSDSSRGENPRLAFCDIRGEGCKVVCTGVNWKCITCWDFDVCDHCEKFHYHENRAARDRADGEPRMHTQECGLLRIYECEFPLDSKWKWK